MAFTGMGAASAALLMRPKDFSTGGRVPCPTASTAPGKALPTH